MATWDGSYLGPDDEDYYQIYADQNTPGPASGNWALFSDNMSHDYLQPKREFYVQNERMFEQNRPNTFYHSNVNVMPNLMATTSYEYVTNPMNTHALNSQEYYSHVVKPEQCYLSDASCNCDNNLTNNRNKYDCMKRIEEPSSSIMNSNKTISGKYFSCNMNRHDKKYNSKKSPNGKHKERQCYKEDQCYKKYAYANYYQQHVRAHKLQGNKYFINKHYSENSQISSECANENASDERPMNNDVACSSKENCATNSNKGESSSNIKISSNRHKNLSNKNNNERIIIDDNNVQDNNDSNVQESNNLVKEFTYYNSGLKQTYNNHRNARRYEYNDRYNKEGNFKERRHHYQRYGRENYGKEDRFRVKDQTCSNEECNEYKDECFNEETASDAKQAIEKRHNYRRYKAFKEHYKENENEHWRSRRKINDRNNIPKRGQNKKSLVDSDASQRERLAEQLNKGELECLVCCEYIKQNDYTWSCSNCYHVFHLKCIKKWVNSSQDDNGWRCPACQNVSSIIPEDYFCFCGKVRAPEWNRRDIAHSCGEVCGRTLSKNDCPHKCTLLCHPGSCPQCTAMVTKYCGCGRTLQTVQCKTHKLLKCDSICGKDLNCGRHKCQSKCHYGECEKCEKTVKQVCHCGKYSLVSMCESYIPPAYACEVICEKLLECGNHICTKLCHPGACESCSLTPGKITTCCCGQTPLPDKRQTCLDPIPVCDQICSKNLNYDPHKCKVKCHVGDCPVCDLTTIVKCRCGNMEKEIACKRLVSKTDVRCEKKCSKKKSCGKHKCNKRCCIETEHTCPAICPKTLSCGKHQCERNCHKGRCQPCWRTSFYELRCECGASVVYPPVPCGARRPMCEKPCSRQHSCGHEVLHNCHSEPNCPPCTVLTQRWCHGKHELRKAVPCYVDEISCGLPCNKPISCGRHKCITTCHSGPCEKPGQQCTQPCTVQREMCGHICAAPCHEGKCPDTPCKEMVKVTCQCGHRTMSRVCAENSKEYQRIASSILASKMADMQLGHSFNLEEVFGQGVKKQNQLKTLDCNDECKIIERNRRLALGLQIANPDLSGKLMPRYSDFMKQWAKKDPHFCQMVHEKLTELVQLAKTSKQKSRSYSFDSMNKDKRHFIHESCEHFGCESQAYDQEPKRNVVATAVKDKCWLPSYSLLEIVQRENGQRKVPGPMLNTTKTDGSVKTILSLPAKKFQKSETPSTIKTSEPEIDYFDYKG
ncbi:Protein shuttle craft [Melipona quadrifasciata]|uniref:Protein shuttle craft n=1 Tax=Melipona quadrifasciata TaxID=166423 RepID=A0A0M8ZML3_9HYME|nr:Protein shuttle craft [Melipona quadrifasciata]